MLVLFRLKGCLPLLGGYTQWLINHIYTKHIIAVDNDWITIPNKAIYPEAYKEAWVINKGDSKPSVSAHKRLDANDCELAVHCRLVLVEVLILDKTKNICIDIEARRTDVVVVRPLLITLPLEAQIVESAVCCFRVLERNYLVRAYLKWV